MFEGVTVRLQPGEAGSDPNETVMAVVSPDRVKGMLGLFCERVNAYAVSRIIINDNIEICCVGSELSLHRRLIGG